MCKTNGKKTVNLVADSEDDVIALGAKTRAPKPLQCSKAMLSSERHTQMGKQKVYEIKKYIFDTFITIYALFDPPKNQSRTRLFSADNNHSVVLYALNRHTTAEEAQK